MHVLASRDESNDDGNLKVELPADVQEECAKLGAVESAKVKACSILLENLIQLHVSTRYPDSCCLQFVTLESINKSIKDLGERPRTMFKIIVWFDQNAKSKYADFLCLRVPYMVSLIENTLCVGDKEIISIFV
ncbi:hypothetical protein L1987_17315 [Smallanthus sonchifolius]|uniref:Uncharacterized protein n=1 Tax=Smallanthus sonchifolius TaxID=185202 RepID=A0ACB9IWG0_9ASTR|nr:hypothetical protein L1987_17315 [Smallanthus sonchifolius]